MSFRDFYDRWGWAIAAAAIVLVVSVLMLGRGAFCSENDQNCVREWLSALGGWAAVVVTVPTVLFAAKQFQDADSAGKQLARQTITRRNSLARRVNQNARVMLARVKSDEKRLRSPSFLPGGGVPPAEARLIAIALREILDENMFAQFEQEIGGSKNSNISLIRGFTDHFIQSAEQPFGMNYQKLEIELIQLLGKTEVYAREMEKIASAFLSENDSLEP
jgi:hypothetical protein